MIWGVGGADKVRLSSAEYQMERKNYSVIGLRVQIRTRPGPHLALSLEGTREQQMPSQATKQ